VEGSVLTGSLFSLWPAVGGLFACLDFCPCPLFPCFPLSWVLSFYKVWQGFINNNYKSCTIISQHPMVMWWQGQTITNVACSMTEQNPWSNTQKVHNKWGPSYGYLYIALSPNAQWYKVVFGISYSSDQWLRAYVWSPEC